MVLASKCVLMISYIQLHLIDLSGQSHQFNVVKGSNLRIALLEHGFSPYTPLTQHLNCGGRGLCATCGVWIEENSPAPMHWHDKAANKFGYPRLSCQITVEKEMTLRLVRKKIWGGRQKQAR